MLLNLIDVTERLATRMDLSYSRIDDNEISITLHGDKSKYDLTVMLQQDYELIYFSSDLDIKISDDKYMTIIEAIVKANERIWIGHFDYVSADNRIMYSLAIPFISSFSEDESIIESTIDIIVTECDRFYHYFLLAMENGKLADVSLNTLFLESVGEA